MSFEPDAMAVMALISASTSERRSETVEVNISRTCTGTKALMSIISCRCMPACLHQFAMPSDFLTKWRKSSLSWGPSSPMLIWLHRLSSRPSASCSSTLSLWMAFDAAELLPDSIAVKALPSSVTQSRTAMACSCIPFWRTPSFLFPNHPIMFFASSLKLNLLLYP